MNQTEQIDLLWERFVHQTTTFTEQKLMTRERGGQQVKEWQFRRAFRGRCDHNPPCAKKTCPNVKPIALERKHLQEHLDGTNTVGLYQLYEDTVKWVCFDIDISKGSEVTDTTWENIRRQTTYLAKRLQALKVPFLVEFSGNRGMHLWVFFSAPVDAAKAYAFGHFVLEDVPVHPDFHIELYPKQPYAPNLGNVVKLPLGVHRKSDKRTAFVSPSFEPYTDQWNVLANVRTMSPEGMDRFLAHYEIATEQMQEWKVRETDVGRGLPCYTNIMSTPVGEGTRDEITFRLAVFLKNHGLPEPIVYAAVSGWNDQNDPPLDDETLGEKVQSAFNRDYSHFACLKPEFEPFCDPNCKFYANRMKNLKKMKRT